MLCDFGGEDVSSTSLFLKYNIGRLLDLLLKILLKSLSTVDESFHVQHSVGVDHFLVGESLLFRKTILVKDLHLLEESGLSGLSGTKKKKLVGVIAVVIVFQLSVDVLALLRDPQKDGVRRTVHLSLYFFIPSFTISSHMCKVPNQICARSLTFFASISSLLEASLLKHIFYSLKLKLWAHQRKQPNGKRLNEIKMEGTVFLAKQKFGFPSLLRTKASKRLYPCFYILLA
mmetsp:Transcript_41306/g.106907  ORF Transcript_41306/g.106907 Transcript_41306/m.106907 type:complete len:230 (+) Transcript_41306:4392-5081(+)